MGGNTGSGGAAGVGGNAGAGGASGAAGSGATAGAGGSGGAAGSGSGGTSGGAGGYDGGATGGAAGQSGGGGVGGFDGGTSFDARDGSGGSGGSGGTIITVLFEENFDSDLGSFQVENGCGPSPPLWSNRGGYAHAAELATHGVSSLYGPPVKVPANVGELRLRLRHMADTELGYDGGQLLVDIDGTTMLVRKTDFTLGAYDVGAAIFPDNCELPPDELPNWVPAWTGALAEFESEVILTAAPFNVVPGNTISIRFRMLVDDKEGKNGWDVNWVRLISTSQ
jgi:hypothetical protein